MANIRTTKGSSIGKTVHNPVYEEFVPAFDWTEDSTSRCLLVDLSGFKREDVKLEVDNQRHILVRGERLVSENKFIGFKQTFHVPEDVNIKEIRGNFEDGILYVTIQKYETEDREDHQQGTANMVEGRNEQKPMNKGESSGRQNAKEGTKIGNEKTEDEEEFHDAYTENPWYDKGPLETVKKKLRMNKEIVLTAIVAFSLGVLVSRKFTSSGD